LIYAPTKLYICYKISFNSTAVPNINFPYIAFYDENNANSCSLMNTNTFDLAGILNYFANYIEKTNMYFSRIAVGSYSNLIFIGYRITLI